MDHANPDHRQLLSAGPVPRLASRRGVGRVLVLVPVLALGLLACGRDAKPGPTSGAEAQPQSASRAPAKTAAVPAKPAKPPVQANHTGNAACGTCHGEETKRWTGSHHDLALQEPTPKTVLGKFDGSELRQGQERFRFVQDQGAFAIEVTADGKPPTRYPVRYVLGVEPLQQYLLDMGDGRLQAVLVAWDARPAEAGGQRWFHLQSDDYAPPGDPLHWAELSYNWNHSCADCHSTGVQRGYDRAKGRYATRFDQIDVGCEACHGNGSAHVNWAQAGGGEGDPQLLRALTKPETRRWVPGEPTAKLEGAQADAELDTCAPCHSRRALLGGAGTFHDAYRLALLDEGLYLADGQIHDEVFVHGSFLQSKMHRAGVVCSDCHEPHSLELRAPGNALCVRCHQPAVFDAVTHHGHPKDSPGAACTACHMPQRRYMGVDDRADHRLAVPNPALADRIGGRDPCRGCHADWSAQRAAEAIASWGGKPRAGFGDTLHLAREGGVKVATKLRSLAARTEEAAIVRATALAALATHPGPALARLLVQTSKDPDPLVRRASATAAANLRPADRDRVVLPLLGDPLRSVRVEATGALLGANPQGWSPADQARFREGLAAYRASREAVADRASALVDLAHLAQLELDVGRAESLLREAIAREPAFSASYVNLADLYRATGREAEARKILVQGEAAAADKAVIQHATGLALVRQGKKAEALQALQAAHRASPDNTRFGFVYAVALADGGQMDEALRVLRALDAKRSGDAEVLGALAEYAGRAGRSDEARAYAERLRTIER